MSQDLWKKLEAEFEKQVPLREVELPAPQAALRPKPHRLAVRTLNGYLPTMLLTLLALALAAHGQGNWVLLGYFFFFVPVLSWLIRPTLYSGRRTPAWLLILGPLYVGGLVETSSAFIQGLIRLQSKQLNPHMRDFEFVKLFESHLEAYLSLGHFAIYLFAGLALYWATRHFERRWYWLDLKPINTLWRWTLVSLLIILPSLLIGMALWQHPWTERELRWVQSQANRPEAQLFDEMDPSYRDQDSSWPDLSKLSRQIPHDATDGEAKLVQKIEAQFLEIWPIFDADPKPSLNDVATINAWLHRLQKNDKYLLQGHKVALASLRYCSRFSDYISKTEMNFLYEQLGKYFASTPLEQIAGLPPAWSLEKTFLVHQEPLAILDAAVYKTLNRETGGQLGQAYALEAWGTGEIYPKPRPMLIFGREIHTTPVSVYARWRTRPSLEWWLESREELSKKKASEYYEVLHRNQLAPKGRKSLPYLSSRLTWTLQSDGAELTKMNYLMVSLRNHRAEKGRWPDSLPQFKESLNLHFDRLECSFDQQSQILRVYDKRKKTEFGQWRLQ